MRGGRSFAIESTLSGTAHVKTIERAKAEGYDIFLIYVFLDTPDMCIARIKGRVKKGGWGFRTFFQSTALWFTNTTTRYP